MKFNSLFRVYFNFLHIRFCELQSIGNNTMKKMLLATALACLLQDAQQTFHISKQSGSSSTRGNHHPHHFFV